jgi:hypothetical protein
MSFCSEGSIKDHIPMRMMMRRRKRRRRAGGMHICHMVKLK